MTYRDELGQAHRRVEHLENELREAKMANAPRPPQPRRRGVVVGLLVLAIAAAIVGAIVYVRTRPAEPMLIASVDQVVLRQADYAGKTMRVQGELVAGTIERGGEPCVLRFTLERKHLRLPVRLAGCVVPALFRDTDGLMIVAEGELRADQGFEARQILVPTPAFSEMR